MQKLIRRCAQCRNRFHRDQLLRIRQIDGQLTLKGQQGRSVYLCASLACLRPAARNKGILRHLPGITPEAWRQWCEVQIGRFEQRQAPSQP